jgi:asparagine synthase (glutamine-hydrolysing)
VRTFSIGFDQPQYDELSYARQVARRFETDHHELVVKPDAAALLPRLVWHYNEPFADSSALPSFSLCEMAREFVTVALNGDGGDEAFIGYDRYLGTVLAGWYDRIPAPVRRVASRALVLVPRGFPKSSAYRLRRFAEVLALEPRRRYGRWLTSFDNGSKAALYTPEFAAQAGSLDSLALLEAAYQRTDAPTFLEATVHSDVQLYLPEDLLVKMDIASMAHSLEVRSPFLDHHVVEFAASLPPSLKLCGLTQKYLLKKVMKDVLPAPILSRKKMGFGVPIDHWFRHELKEMAYDLLLGDRAHQRGYFRPDAVRRYLDEHVRGQGHHHYRLWTLLMLELWHRLFIDQPCPGEAPSCA